MYHLLVRERTSPPDWYIAWDFDSLEEANESADKWRACSGDYLYIVATAYYVSRIQEGIKQ